jgi:hypothetical protein
MILKWILKEQNGRVWTWLIWLRIGTSEELLWAWWSICLFQKLRGILWIGENLLASQEGLCSVGLGITSVSLKYISGYGLREMIAIRVWALKSLFSNTTSTTLEYIQPSVKAYKAVCSGTYFPFFCQPSAPDSTTYTETICPLKKFVCPDFKFSLIIPKLHMEI